jgi:glycosyltransferase involved in cell wall biosynthesis
VVATRYPQLQIVIVDDASSDDSVAVIEEAQRAYPGVAVDLHFHPGRRNRGIARTRNLAIRNARGKYVCFLDADDEFYPNRFDFSLPLLASRPEIEAVVEPFDWVYASGQRGQEMAGKPRQMCSVPAWVLRPEGPSPGELFEGLLKDEFMPHTTSITVRRSALDETGLFPPLRYCLEKPLWFKIFARERVACQGRVSVAGYLLHENSTCARRENTAAFRFDVVRSLMAAYPWLRRHSPRPGYTEMVKDAAAGKFYHYSSYVLSLQHRFVPDVLLAWARFGLVFPGQMLTQRFWRAILHLVRRRLFPQAG